MEAGSWAGWWRSCTACSEPAGTRTPIRPRANAVRLRSDPARVHDVAEVLHGHHPDVLGHLGLAGVHGQDALPRLVLQQRQVERQVQLLLRGELEERHRGGDAELVQGGVVPLVGLRGPGLRQPLRRLFDLRHDRVRGHLWTDPALGDAHRLGVAVPLRVQRSAQGLVHVEVLPGPGTRAAEPVLLLARVADPDGEERQPEWSKPHDLLAVHPELAPPVAGHDVGRNGLGDVHPDATDGGQSRTGLRVGEPAQAPLDLHGTPQLDPEAPGRGFRAGRPTPGSQHDSPAHPEVGPREVHAGDRVAVDRPVPVAAVDHDPERRDLVALLPQDVQGVGGAGPTSQVDVAGHAVPVASHVLGHGLGQVLAPAGLEGLGPEPPPSGRPARGRALGLTSVRGLVRSLGALRIGSGGVGATEIRTLRGIGGPGAVRPAAARAPVRPAGVDPGGFARGFRLVLRPRRHVIHVVLDRLQPIRPLSPPRLLAHRHLPITVPNLAACTSAAVRPAPAGSHRVSHRTGQRSEPTKLPSPGHGGPHRHLEPRAASGLPQLVHVPGAELRNHLPAVTGQDPGHHLRALDPRRVEVHPEHPARSEPGGLERERAVRAEGVEDAPARDHTLQPVQHQPPLELVVGLQPGEAGVAGALRVGEPDLGEPPPRIGGSDPLELLRAERDVQQERHLDASTRRRTGRVTNSRTTASSRSLTRAWTTVPSWASSVDRTSASRYSLAVTSSRPNGTSRVTSSGGFGRAPATASRSSSSPSPVSADTSTAPGYRRRTARRAASSSRSALFRARTSGRPPAPISARTSRTAPICWSSPPADASATWSTREASATSSSVERNASTRSWGSLPTNPTVSETVTSRPPGSDSRRVVGSSVANSWSATSTPASVSAFISVDLPAFVYPAMATWGMPLDSRRDRFVCRVRDRCWMSRRSLEMRRRMCCRSTSSLVSPGPRVPIPPPSRDMASPHPRSRGSR